MIARALPRRIPGAGSLAGALVLAVLVMASVPAGDDPPAAAQGPDFFEARVRPVLVKSCIQCHGGERVRSDFSLATRETLLAGGSRGPAIDLEAPEKSLLLRALRYDDKHLRMPPDGKLPPEQITVLREWLTRRAPWTEGEEGRLGRLEAHEEERQITDEERDSWVYRPVARPEVPQVSDAAWGEHAMDAFIFARLADAGLRPAPQADQVTLIRRATYDLIGLPPTPAEVDAFLADERPDAWARVIERLLASPHYGEKWGRHWLDLVRFAETNGYERDSTKLNMWRYRDYVIRAFNEDKPYDRFIIEQIAGDEIEEPTPDSLIATGYHRLMIWDDEPVDRNQSRADVLADLVDVTGQAFLGTTVGCARCHDHKKDPITQRDYYSLMAFFNNLSDFGVGDRITRKVPDPPRPGESIWTSVERDAEISRLHEELAPTLSTLEAAWRAAARETPEEPQTLVATSRDTPQQWRFTTRDPGNGWETPGFDDRSWKQGPGGFGSKGTPGSVVGTPWTTPDIYLRKRFRLTEIPETLALMFHHDEDLQVYLNGARVLQRRGYRASYDSVQLPPKALTSLVVGSNVIAVHCRQTGGGQFVDVGLATGIVQPDDARIWMARLRRDGVELLGAVHHDIALELDARIEEARAKPVREVYPAPIAFEKGSKAPPQFVHVRGNANVPGKPVQPAFPEVLGFETPVIPEPPRGARSTGRRLVLARWLASPENPMTSRVMANRLWQFHFGRGIVRSSSDFGKFGTGPTHPQLLDYLASELVARGWSLKAMHRFIMSSRAYRMSSQGHPDGLARDPENQLLWRFHMRRLTAEEIRDAILATNGTLNRQMFGPSIYTRLPKEVLATSSRPGQAWGRSAEDQRDRRSIYVFVKRSLREPILEAFDQADTDSSCAVRFTTNVPTQTLMFLNSDFMQEEAGLLAERPEQEAGPEPEARVRLGLRLTLGREPDEREVADHVAFVKRIREVHGLSDAVAFRYFALVVYNLNEFLFLD